jgi:hypothetical protein
VTSISDLDLDSVVREIAAPPPEPSPELVAKAGAFKTAMLSLDEHMAKFDDPSKIATFSDCGRGAERVRSYVGCEDVRSGEVDPAVKKRMLNKLRKYPHLQKTLRRFIRNATSEKRKPVKKTHIEKICEILF